MVRVICYGKEDIWKNREDAIRFYREGVACCDGSERERYVNVLMDLLDGKAVCTDER